ncbi:MAG: M15 family metallopeptidase [Methylovulum sp.]|nr:M15 family metallopeptidase [Methylovulum sp.]
MTHPLLTSARLLTTLGNPQDLKLSASYLVLWDVPATIELGAIPDRVYLNKYMVKSATAAFTHIVQRGLVNELKTFNGCYSVRLKKGGSTFSLHSWGLAFDFNAETNGFGRKPTLSAALVACFTDAGFDWGGKWGTPDGMHFQLSAAAFEAEYSAAHPTTH